MSRLYTNVLLLSLLLLGFAQNIQAKCCCTGADVCECENGVCKQERQDSNSNQEGMRSGDCDCSQDDQPASNAASGASGCSNAAVPGESYCSPSREVLWTNGRDAKRLSERLPDDIEHPPPRSIAYLRFLAVHHTNSMKEVFFWREI